MSDSPHFRGNRRLDGPEIVVPFEEQRRQMVDRQLRGRDIRDVHVLRAMRQVPRHEFLPTHLRHAAYLDSALPIGEGETLSQPYIVALICQALGQVPGGHVLDVGSGTGYQSAVLAAMGCVVWGIEIDPQLAEISQSRLKRLGYENAEIRAGDGALGWAEHAPFDGIAVDAAVQAVPPALLRQLREGGRLVAPLGGPADQMLVRMVRNGEQWPSENLLPVKFVPFKASRD